MTDPNFAPSWVLGLDVSYSQPNVDWSSLAQNGYAFAFIKATEGITLTDPTFSSHWAGAQAADLIRGPYHYYIPGDDPQQQAESFLNVILPANGQPLLTPEDLPPVLDIETALNQTSEEIVQGIQTWLSLVSQKTRRVPILYTNRGFWDTLNTTQFGNYPLWVSEYDVAAPSQLPAGWSTWQFWQYSQTGSLEGISGNVDLDVYQGDRQSLQQFVSSSFRGGAPG